MSSASGTTRGFTAINTSSSQALNMTVSATSLDPNCDANHNGPRTIVSAYLGRGDNHSSKAAVATSIASARQVVNRSRRRVSDSWNATKPKRPKSEQGCDGHNVSKTEAVVDHGACNSPEIAGRVQLLENRTSEPQERLTVNTDQARIDTGQAVFPVYATATSMTSLRPTVQMTSIDHLRASAKYGHSIYATPPMPHLQQTGVESTKSWENVVLSTQNPRLSSPVGTLVDRQHTPSIVDGDKSTDQTLSSRQSSFSSNILGTVANYTTSHDFDLNSDDDFDEEALRIVDSMSNTIKLTPAKMDCLRNTSRSSLQQLTRFSSSDPFGFNYTDKQAVEDLQWHKGTEYDPDETQEDCAKRLTNQTVPDNRPRESPQRLRTAKQNVRIVDADEDYGGIIVSAEEPQTRNQRASTISPGSPGPITRSLFPSPVLDRSPLFGVCKSTSLRTCFRIGEVLNVGCHAVRQNKSVILEIYARVTQSWREDRPSRKQNFLFRDLYHDKPPVLNGSYELWDQLRMWDLDSRPFLCATEHGVLCRAIATMKRDGKDWRLEVLSIWGVSWDDIEYVAGIYKGDTGHGTNGHARN